MVLHATLEGPSDAPSAEDGHLGLGVMNRADPPWRQWRADPA